MVDRSEVFAREVDEELRREQFQKLWDQYGIYAMVVVAAVVLGVGGYKFWEARRQSQTEAAGARFETASLLASEGKADEALAAFADIGKSGPAGYRPLAQFQIANAHLKAGRSAEALAAFEALAKDASIDPAMKDFAALKSAMLRLDTADWTEMENRLTPLLKEGSPWRAMARETLALAAYKAGKADEAKKHFEQTMADRTAPPAVAERAVLMMSLLTDAEGAKTAVVVPIPANVPPKGEAAKTEPAKGPPAQKGPAGQKK